MLTQMKHKLKFRHYSTVIGLIIAIVALFGTDPGAGLIHVPFGAEVLSKLSGLPAATFGVTLIYLGTKTLLDYFDMGKLHDRAYETPQGAGLALIAAAITRLAVALVIIGMVSIFA